jgi:aspartate-semialdehyde dehydrogenase
MNVGLIGWRGMVGSVLVQRMREERDFDLIEPVFFSTSQAGAAAPAIGKRVPPVKDAKDLSELTALDVLISCQGGDYTSEMYPKLRESGWQPDAYGNGTALPREPRRVDDADDLSGGVGRRRAEHA